MSLKQLSLTVEEHKYRREIAVLQRQGSIGVNNGLFWLGGFKSDMMGSKALMLDDLGQKLGLEVTRFDYSGHGQSGGKIFASHADGLDDGTISHWLEEAKAVFAKTNGEQIIIGSSMGGWLALLLNRALDEKAKKRIKAIVLIAPAIDMSKDLMVDLFSKQQLLELENNGFIEQPSDYDEPYIITKKLIDDGKQHLLFGAGSIIVNCPIHILQGGQDKAVPISHSLKLMAHLTQDEVNYTLIPDGDHSLSREQDLSKLQEVIKQFLL